MLSRVSYLQFMILLVHSLISFGVLCFFFLLHDSPSSTMVSLMLVRGFTFLVGCLVVVVHMAETFSCVLVVTVFVQVFLRKKNGPT